jgi:hypothetical protein
VEAGWRYLKSVKCRFESDWGHNKRLVSAPDKCASKCWLRIRLQSVRSDFLRAVTALQGIGESVEIVRKQMSV